MNDNVLLIVGVAALVVCAGVAYIGYKNGILGKKGKKQKQLSDIPTKEMDGTLAMTDVVGWFRNLQLDPQTDTPFMADAEKLNNILTSLSNVSDFIFPPSSIDLQNNKKNKRLILGVYNEKSDEISHALFILADDFDAQVQATLGNEQLVVLS